MAKIIVYLNGQMVNELPIDRARIHVGRRPSNNLVLDHLTVSGRHAAIDTISEGTYILDLGSTNGTTVNGQPVKKHLLQDKDVVEVGKYQLKYDAEIGVAKPIGSVRPILAKIKILTGANAGKEMNLMKNVTTLGSPGILVVSIHKEEAQLTISFVEGKLFPKINGQEIDARPRILNDKDIIDLSGTKMEVSIVQA